MQTLPLAACWQKISSDEKIVPVGLRWFHRVFHGQPRITLAFLHLKTVMQNASLEAELLGLAFSP